MSRIGLRFRRRRGLLAKLSLLVRYFMVLSSLGIILFGFLVCLMNVPPDGWHKGAQFIVFGLIGLIAERKS